MSYAEQIATLYARHITKRDKYGSSDELFIALGCRTLQMVASRYEILTSSSPSAEHEALIGQTLVRMLQVGVGVRDTRPNEAFSLLDGLAKNDRWRSCLETTVGAYRLVDLLLSFHSICLGMDMSLTTDEVKLEFHGIMQQPFIDWLGLPAPGEYPSMEMLTRAMFGDAYYDLILADLAPREVPHQVKLNRPPFMPGLIRAQVNESTINLPDLDTAPFS